ncbi:MAG: hypothetical protein R3C11_27940 [Planctomycetaceae bacterium]
MLERWNQEERNTWICEVLMKERTRGGVEYLDNEEWKPIPDYCGDWETAMQLVGHLRDTLSREERIRFFQCLSRNCFLKVSSSLLSPEELLMLNSCSYELLWLEPGDVGAAAHEALSSALEGNTLKPEDLAPKNLSPLEGPML